MTDVEPILELVEGATYRAKKPRKLFDWSIWAEVYNDRKIIHVGRDFVQYDGPAVRIGRHFPSVSHEAFRKWADFIVEQKDVRA